MAHLLSKKPRVKFFLEKCEATYKYKTRAGGWKIIPSPVDIRISNLILRIHNVGSRMPITIKDLTEGTFLRFKEKQERTLLLKFFSRAKRHRAKWFANEFVCVLEFENKIVYDQFRDAYSKCMSQSDDELSTSKKTVSLSTVARKGCSDGRNVDGKGLNSILTASPANRLISKAFGTANSPVNDLVKAEENEGDVANGSSSALKSTPNADKTVAKADVKEAIDEFKTAIKKAIDMAIDNATENLIRDIKKIITRAGE